MAVLRYDQVTAPDFRGVGSILENASNTLMRTGDSASQLFKDLSKSRADAAETQLKLNLAGLTPEQYDLAGRKFLLDQNNRELFKRLGVMDQDKISKLNDSTQANLLKEYANSIMTGLNKQVREEGFRSIPELFSNSSAKAYFESLPLTVQQELIRSNPVLQNYKMDVNYQNDPGEFIEGKIYPIPEKESGIQQENPKNTSITSNSLDSLKLDNNSISIPTQTTLDLSKFNPESIEIAKKAIEDYGYTDEIPSQKIMLNWPELNPLKYNNEAYQVAKLLVEQNKQNSTKEITQGTNSLRSIGNSLGQLFSGRKTTNNKSSEIINNSLISSEEMNNINNTPKVNLFTSSEDTEQRLIPEDSKKYPNSFSEREKELIATDAKIPKFIANHIAKTNNVPETLNLFRTAVAMSKTPEEIYSNLELLSSDPIYQSNNTKNELVSSVKSSKTNSNSPKPLTISANTLMNPASSASKFLDDVSRQVELKQIQFNNNYQEKFTKFGLSLDEADKLISSNAPVSISEVADDLFKTIATPEYIKENPTDTQELKTRIIESLAKGMELGINPSLMKGIILASVKEENPFFQYIKGKTVDINSSKVAEDIKNNYQALRNNIEKYKVDKAELIASTQPILDLKKSVKDSQLQKQALINKGFFGSANLEDRKVNAALSRALPYLQRLN